VSQSSVTSSYTDCVSKVLSYVIQVARSKCQYSVEGKNTDNLSSSRTFSVKRFVII